MAVSARFEADFSQFVAATKGAEAALGKVVAGGAGVGRTFRGMEDGASTAAGKLDTFNLSISQASALLGRFGFSIPPVVRGLLDLGNLAAAAQVGVAGVGAAAAPAAASTAAVGTSAAAAATGIGAMGAAALAAGSALAGWTLGEKIGEVTGWTQAIADGTAKLLGWGDVASQEAAAGADVLARASKTAGRAITDQTEAMNINQQEAFALIDANIRTGASMQQLAADTKVAEAAMVALSKAKLEAQERSVAQEHKLLIAGMQREADNAKAYADMKKTTAANIATAEINSRNFREMEAQFENERLRAHQDVDIQTSQRRLAAAGSTPAPFGGVPFAMRTPESYGGFTLPIGPAAAPVPIAARSSGVGSARGGVAAPVQVYVSGVFDPASSRQIADVVGKVQTSRGLALRRW